MRKNSGAGNILSAAIAIAAIVEVVPTPVRFGIRYQGMDLYM
jgi:hypothetical protein